MSEVRRVIRVQDVEIVVLDEGEEIFPRSVRCRTKTIPVWVVGVEISTHKSRLREFPEKWWEESDLVVRKWSDVDVPNCDNLGREKNINPHSADLGDKGSVR